MVERLNLWVRARSSRRSGPLRAAGLAAHDPASPPAVRSILALLVDEGGIVAREAVAEAARGARARAEAAVTGLEIRIGALDLFMPDV